jgi:molybdenum cofactor biosynthesis enzyme MoaA
MEGNNGILTQKFIELRQSILNNERNSQCESCWERDDNTNMSPRRTSQHLKNPEVWKNKWETLDLYQPVNSLIVTFSNKCQMMCIYCSPQVSSMWEDSQHRLPFKGIKHRPDIEQPKKLEELADMSKVTGLTISGGEPMMEQACIDFLQTLEPNHNRHMGIVTNLSYGNAVFNTLIDILNRHGRMATAVSLDSMGENKTRKYLNWDLWQSNFEKLISNFSVRKKIFTDIHIGVIITVTILNYMDVQGILEYIISFRKKGIDIRFSIHPIDSKQMGSMASGRLDPTLTIQLGNDEQYLSDRERWMIDSFNKLIIGTILDTELEKLTQEYFKEYFK